MEVLGSCEERCTGTVYEPPGAGGETVGVVCEVPTGKDVRRPEASALLSGNPIESTITGECRENYVSKETGGISVGF